MIAVSHDERWEIERFFYLEADLLDDRRYKEWLGLFTPDIHYFAPIRRTRLSEGRKEDWAVSKELSGPDEIALYDDNLISLGLRVERLGTGYAWSEDPPSMTRHLFTNIVPEPGEKEGEYRVTANFLVRQVRRDHSDYLFTGQRTDEIRRSDGQLRYARRRIVLDSSVLSASKISVFF